MMDLIKQYKQYFTPKPLAKFMVSIIPENNIQKVIDLSMGECGLLVEGKKRWHDATYFGVDIDSDLISTISKKYSYIHTYTCDSLSTSLNNWKEYIKTINKDKFCLALANPPFDYYDQKEAVLYNGQKSTLKPIEVRFLLKYLEIIRCNGYIAIILPYGFLSSDSYRDMRIYLLKKTNIIMALKIFSTCFSNMKADTCLVLLQKKSNEFEEIQDYVNIGYLNSDFKIVNELSIHFSNAIDRMDIDFYLGFNSLSKITYNRKLRVCSLSNYLIDCKRGRTITTMKCLITDKGTCFIHTTNIRNMCIDYSTTLHIKSRSAYFKNAKLLEGDLIIARVGTNCLGKVAIAHNLKGSCVLSDCLYRLRVRNINPFFLVVYFATKYAQIQIKSYAKGSCSKYITKADLLKVKVPEVPQQIQESIAGKYHEIFSIRGMKNKAPLYKELVAELEDILDKEELL